MERQKVVTPVLRDDEIGWKAFVRLAGDTDPRIGAEPHAEKGGGRAAVQQSHAAVPVPRSIGKIGSHRSEPLCHETAANSSDHDAADRQRKQQC